MHTSVEEDLAAAGIIIKDLGDGVVIHLSTRATEINKNNWRNACIVNDWAHSPCPEPPVLDETTEYVQPITIKKGDPRRKMDKRARAFHISINNPTNETMRHLDRTMNECQYARVGYEVGKNHGTPHLQGVLYFTNPRVNHQVFAMIGGVGYCKVCYSSVEKNAIYTAKDDCTLFAVGASPPKQGARNDLDALYDALESGITDRDTLKMRFGGQHLGLVDKWFKLMEPGKDWKPEVRWYFGQSGCGKSTAAKKWLGKEDLWHKACDKPGSQGWIDGYDGHHDVLLDEIRPGFFDVAQILAMLGDGECRMPTKGSFRQFRPRRIAITTVYDPERFWNMSLAYTKQQHGKEDTYYQLERRIDRLIYVPPRHTEKTLPRLKLELLDAKTGDDDNDDILMMAEMPQAGVYPDLEDINETLNPSESDSDIESFASHCSSLSQELCTCRKPLGACICEDFERYVNIDEEEEYFAVPKYDKLMITPVRPASLIEMPVLRSPDEFKSSLAPTSSTSASTEPVQTTFKTSKSMKDNINPYLSKREATRSRLKMKLLLKSKSTKN